MKVLVSLLLMFNLMIGNSVYAESNSMEKVYYDTGEVMIEYQVDDKGEVDGYSKYFSPTGELLEQFNYSSGRILGVNGEPYTGILTVNFKDGKIWREASFKEGKKDGVTTIYYPSGIIQTRSHYKNNLPHGVHEEYSKEGRLISRFIYKNGELNGPSEIYYENGNIRQAKTYKNGLVEGEILDFYEEYGSIYSRTITKNGKLTGKSTTYYPYKNDKPSSFKVLKEGYKGYKIGERSGVYFLEDGLLQGEYTEYYRDGSVKTKGKYVNGKKSGLETFYYPEGDLGAETNYKNGQAHGEYKMYYRLDDRRRKICSEDCLQSKGRFVNGKQHGEKLYFTLEGDISGREYYENDELIPDFTVIEP